MPLTRRTVHRGENKVYRRVLRSNPPGERGVQRGGSYMIGVASSRLMSVVGAFALAMRAAGPLHAQAWKPSKAIEIIVGTSPGGPQDRMGRAVQRIMQEKKLVDVPVNVVNKAGGGGA